MLRTEATIGSRCSSSPGLFTCACTHKRSQRRARAELLHVFANRGTGRNATCTLRRRQVFDKEGAFKFTIGKSGSSGSGNDALNGAYGTSVDCAADGLVYVRAPPPRLQPSRPFSLPRSFPLSPSLSPFSPP